MLTEECIDGKIERKDLEILELKRRIEIQRQEVEHLRDENQKKSNHIKAEQLSTNSIIEEKTLRIENFEKELTTYKKKLTEMTKEVNNMKKKEKKDAEKPIYENETELKKEIETLKKEIELQTSLTNQAQESCKVYGQLIAAKDQIISNITADSQNRRSIKQTNENESKNQTNTKAKTKVCFNFQKGQCENENCTYNHPKETCKFYEKSGSCRKGFRCHYAHVLPKIPKNVDTSNRFDPLQIEDHRIEEYQNNEIPATTKMQQYNTSMHTEFNNRRPEVCITERYLQNFKPVTVPGNNNYANMTKYGRKIFIVGDSHIRRLRRDDFNKELRGGKAFFRSFSGANARQLQHYIMPTLQDDKPDAIIIHVGTNDILTNSQDEEEIATNILKIAEYCSVAGVNDIFISGILIKKNPRLTAVVRRVNDLLREHCATNNLHFIENDNITKDFLWNDGIHLQDLGTSILSDNFCKMLNYVLYGSKDRNSN